MEAVNIKKNYEGEYLSYYTLSYKLPDDSIKQYEMVSKKGTHRNPTELTFDNIGKETNAVVLLIFNQDHTKMLLSKEFRLGVNNWVVSEIAGLIDAGETIEQASARELKEETGLTLTKIVDILPSTFTCAPVTDDLTSLVICEAEGEITGSDSPLEIIEASWYTKDEVKELLRNSKYIFAGRAQAFAYMWANS